MAMKMAEIAAQDRRFADAGAVGRACIAGDPVPPVTDARKMDRLAA
jgi:hypothetical protein